MDAKKIIKIVIVGLLLLTFFNNSEAQDNTTNLKGQIVTYNPNVRNYVPVPNIKVELMYFDYQSRRWVVIFPTYSDQQGWFYFYNVRHGNYQLRIDNRIWRAITVVPIDKRYYQYQDLGRIVI